MRPAIMLLTSVPSKDGTRLVFIEDVILVKGLAVIEDFLVDGIKAKSKIQPTKSMTQVFEQISVV